MRKMLLAAFAVTVSLGLARGDDEADRAKKIEEHIQKGLEAHRAGEPQAAIDQLQKAMLLLQKSVEKDLAAFLPAPAEGWEADDPDVSSGMWGAGEQSFQFTTATRRYTRKEDGRSVEIVLTNSPQMVDMQKQMITAFSNPQMAAMLNADPDRKIEMLEEEGWAGMLTVEKEGDAQLISVSGIVLVTIQVDAADGDMARDFWKAIDRKALAAAAKAK